MRCQPCLHLALASTLATLLVCACSGEAVIDNDGGGGASSTTTSSTTTSSTTTSSTTTSSTSSGVGGSGGGVDCNPDGVLCDGPMPACDQGEVPSVVNQCWGPCVPILACATVTSCDDCVTGWCAAYVGWSTEYRCLAPAIPCSAWSCNCFGPFLCADPYDACVIGGPGDPAVFCECTTC